MVMLLTTIALVGGAVAGRRLWGTMDEDVDSFTDTLVSPPSSIGSLIGGNAAGEIGDMVFLNHVQLRAGPQPNVFVISGAKGNQMLVVSEPGFSPPHRRQSPLISKAAFAHYRLWRFLEGNGSLVRIRFRVLEGSKPISLQNPSTSRNRGRKRTKPARYCVHSLRLAECRKELGRRRRKQCI